MKQATDQLYPAEIAVLTMTLEKLVQQGIEGDVVELGCYEGGSAVAMQEVLKRYDYPKQLWLYDSFEGLPKKSTEDESEAGKQFAVGSLKASKSRLERHFHKRDLDLPEIRKAWFWELDVDDLPEQIAFAFLDGDYYESIMDSLKLVWDRMADGGLVAIDDYDNHALAGVKKAVDAWAALHPCHMQMKNGLQFLLKR
jgi:O-methyltransferase